VGGYAVEYSGPMLMMFYLCEYLHLVISSVHFVIFFCGGWFALKFCWFLPSIFLTPHDVHYWYELFTYSFRIFAI
jgi:NADH:ubiquinone oxidoreductase subunit H